jgi:hypothetical protein
VQARQLSYGLFRDAHHKGKGIAFACVLLLLYMYDLYRQKLVGKEEDPEKGIIS